MLFHKYEYLPAYLNNFYDTPVKNTALKNLVDSTMYSKIVPKLKSQASEPETIEAIFFMLNKTNLKL